MDKEDKQIRDFFKGFNPRPTSSEKDFMTRLNRSMDSVEIIRSRQKATSRRNRIAATVAALVGFVAGFVLALFLPAINGILGRVTGLIPEMTMTSRETATEIISYLMIGAITVSASLATYRTVRRGSPTRVRT